MDVLSECEVSHEFSGAMVVSIFFLSVFVALLLGDAFLTQTALARTLTRNVRLEREKLEQLAALDADIVNRSMELKSIGLRLNDFARGKATNLGVEHGLLLATSRNKGVV
jgi:hypothetical protein